uniref:Uncharacterized protein n=1 Tax=Rhizophora mucronata TaxID=61149 RepID=A0A2P2LSV3_RHIMU
MTSRSRGGYLESEQMFPWS